MLLVYELENLKDGKNNFIVATFTILSIMIGNSIRFWAEAVKEF